VTKVTFERKAATNAWFAWYTSPCRTAHTAGPAKKPLVHTEECRYIDTVKLWYLVTPV
jgi:hypothetical protein